MKNARGCAMIYLKIRGRYRVLHVYSFILKENWRNSVLYGMELKFT